MLSSLTPFLRVGNLNFILHVTTYCYYNKWTYAIHVLGKHDVDFVAFEQGRWDEEGPCFRD